jgi:tRNA-specific 2-thiouridylase
MSCKKIALGMSGGVDSSVSAYVLQKQGYHVIGLFMKNWEDDEAACAAVQDYEDVVRTCEQLNVCFYSVNFVQQYKDRVFERFLKDSQKGLTPNPDILCNQHIKFDLLRKKAKELDCSLLGHRTLLSKRCNRSFVQGKRSTERSKLFS